jgi:hypothetical protein
VRNLDALSRSISRSFYVLGLTLMACVFVLCGAIFVRNITVVRLSDIPILSWIFWSFAVYLMGRIALLKKF